MIVLSTTSTYEGVKPTLEETMPEQLTVLDHKTEPESRPLKVLTTCDDVVVMGRHWNFTPSVIDGVYQPEPRVLFVCVHGFGASSFSFEQVGPSLRQLGEVIAFDRPGFGFTKRPVSWEGVDPYSLEFSTKIVQSLWKNRPSGCEKLVLVGHSMGVMSAVEYAVTLNRGELGAMICINPCLYPQSVSYWAALCYFLTHPSVWPSSVIFMSLWATANIFVEARNYTRLRQCVLFLFNRCQNDIKYLLSCLVPSLGPWLVKNAFADRNKMPADTIHGYIQPLKEEGWQHGLQAFLRAIVAEENHRNVSQKVPQVMCPVMVATGSKDVMVAKWVQERIKFDAAAEFQSHELHTGHNLHEEEPRLFVDLAKQFVLRHVCRQSSS
mmetsp:Transcript_21735/g.47734  ORF Transcript_21735/g.47734 Transcript_21735/m.47734 type:complete len:380 (-) Transcript_21735:312-1451(-)